MHAYPSKYYRLTDRQRDRETDQEIGGMAGKEIEALAIEAYEHGGSIGGYYKDEIYDPQPPEIPFEELPEWKRSEYERIARKYIEEKEKSARAADREREKREQRLSDCFKNYPFCLCTTPNY